MDIKTLPLGELRALYVEVAGELQRRDALAKAAAEMEKAADDVAKAAGVTRPAGEGEAWVQPSGVHDAYRKDATVTHGGKTWVATSDWNVWEPGVSGWREIVPDGAGPAAWVQPTGAHDAYEKGDRVRFEGAIYESVIDANVWSPTAHSAGWRRITE